MKKTKVLLFFVTLFIATGLLTSCSSNVATNDEAFTTVTSTKAQPIDYLFKGYGSEGELEINIKGDFPENPSIKTSWFFLDDGLEVGMEIQIAEKFTNAEISFAYKNTGGDVLFVPYGEKIEKIDYTYTNGEYNIPINKSGFVMLAKSSFDDFTNNYTQQTLTDKKSGITISGLMAKNCSFTANYEEERGDIKILEYSLVEKQDTNNALIIAPLTVSIPCDSTDVIVKAYSPKNSNCFLYDAKDAQGINHCKAFDTARITKDGFYCILSKEEAFDEFYPTVNSEISNGKLVFDVSNTTNVFYVAKPENLAIDSYYIQNFTSIPNLQTVSDGNRGYPDLFFDDYYETVGE